MMHPVREARPSLYPPLAPCCDLASRKRLHARLIRIRLSSIGMLQNGSASSLAMTKLLQLTCQGARTRECYHNRICKTVLLTLFCVSRYGFVTYFDM